MYGRIAGFSFFFFLFLRILDTMRFSHILIARSGGHQTKLLCVALEKNFLCLVNFLCTTIYSLDILLLCLGGFLRRMSQSNLLIHQTLLIHMMPSLAVPGNKIVAADDKSRASLNSRKSPPASQIISDARFPRSRSRGRGTLA